MPACGPEGFVADVMSAPEWLWVAAGRLADGDYDWPQARVADRIVLAGMGSSYYAAASVAQRLRASGFNAVAELASTDGTWPADRRTLVVAVSASGASPETCSFLDRYRSVSPTVALTNVAGSPLTQCADHTVEMAAGVEGGGVACRTYRHTLVALTAMVAQLTNTDRQLIDRVKQAAAATSTLLAERDQWLGDVVDLLDGPGVCALMAPAERLASAQQGSLMIREVPRKVAVGSETGDWSHVDVYLTKSTDYRALVFTGSRWETEAARWLTERGSKVVAVGGGFPGAHRVVRYSGDEDRYVALLTEITVAELVAAAMWTTSAENPDRPV